MLGVPLHVCKLDVATTRAGAPVPSMKFVGNTYKLKPLGGRVGMCSKRASNFLWYFDLALG